MSITVMRTSGSRQSAHDAFALGQQRLADAAALQPGHDGEHAEVAVSVLFGHVRAGQQRVAALGQHHAAARALDVGAQHVGVDAVAVEEIGFRGPADAARSEEHTSEIKSLMRISYAVLCLKKKKNIKIMTINTYLSCY